MGWTLYDPKTAPDTFSIVWCKLPYRGAKLAPGPGARPVLVLDVRAGEYAPRGAAPQKYADITVAYGTGAENVILPDSSRDLVIDALEFRSLGLHKPTVFQLDPGNRKRLPWCEEYFVPPDYVVGAQLILGKLSSHQQSRVLKCFATRGLTFPLP